MPQDRDALEYSCARRWGDTVAVGNLSHELEGPLQLELAKAVDQLPGEHGMSGGARYELKWDGFIH